MNKTIYKKIDQAETLKRPMKPLSTKHKTQARATVQKFIDLLKSTN
jgi:hypothetical protein